MKYIFVAGAPGSKWSSVVKNIYYSADVDRSDYRDEWTYYHDASGQQELMHLGAYFDPGMVSDIPEDITTLDRSQLEAIFNAPFAGTGTRIIKSHIFCYQQNIDYLKQLFPESPVVLVYRDNDSCLGWWVKCGHFDITYPSYHGYYKNLREMSGIIARQNCELLSAWHSYSGQSVQDNHQLCAVLGIEPPPDQYQQMYQVNDIEVKVI
jgi:hypothetical protein